MASNATYVGAVILELDGVDIEALNFNYEHNTGRTAVKTMNKTGRKKGYAMGVKEWTVSFDVPKMIGEAQINWADISRSKLTFYPVEKPWDRQSLRDFFVMTVSEAAKTEEELVVSITGEAFNLIREG